MKNTRRFITGLIALTAFIIFNSEAQADICGLLNIDTQYKEVYCGIRLDDNETVDEEIVEILANQFSIDEEIIVEILANTICKTVKTYSEDEKKDLPQPVQDGCLPSGKTTEQVLGSLSIFSDIRNTYEKERAIHLSKSSLEFKFEASEQYWDGTIALIGDAPFDLIVDLNLIEIVLFGSKAQWMNDVYAFPAAAEEDEEAEEELPADELLPEEEEVVVEGETEEIPEPGVEVVPEEEEELPPECVPPDDPEADLGEGPSSSYKNPLCGNGTVDILMAEQCDDGNTKSGDGCNQYCQTEASGSNDQCIDPEAITFKKPEDGAGTGIVDGTADGTGGIECPPGMVPKKGVGIVGEPAGPPAEVPQSSEYPGPFLGGTLKQFPESTRPPCGPGDSPLQITIAGETHIATDGEGDAICIPSPICADPDIARTILAALPPLLIPNGDWKALPDDDPRKEWVDSIEAIFCVNIIEHNRPQSAYQMIEGCVDCHISAMVDALEKALQTNVSPLKNTTSAFGISSAHVPNFSFNLSTAFKSKLKYESRDNMAIEIRRANEIAAKWRKDNTPPELTIKKLAGSPLAELTKEIVQAEKTENDIKEEARTYKLGNQVISDQIVGGRVIPLLIQMRDSFINIQSKYMGIIGSTALDKKPECPK